jgi:hypothetical protein
LLPLWSQQASSGLWLLPYNEPFINNLRSALLFQFSRLLKAIEKFKQQYTKAKVLTRCNVMGAIEIHELPVG